MMVCSDDSQPELIRASIDQYKLDTNFSDLPDLPSFSQEEMQKCSFLTKLNELNEMSRKMQYDEKLQALLYRQKNVKAFKSNLQTFNRSLKDKRGKFKLRFKLPEP